MRHIKTSNIHSCLVKALYTRVTLGSWSDSTNYLSSFDSHFKRMRILQKIKFKDIKKQAHRACFFFDSELEVNTHIYTVSSLLKRPSIFLEVSCYFSCSQAINIFIVHQVIYIESNGFIIIFTKPSNTRKSTFS